MFVQVNTVDLHASSRTQGQSTHAVTGLPDDLARLLRLLGESAGSPSVAGSAASAARRWQRAGHQLTGEADALARGVGGSALDYELAESTQRRRFTAPR